MDKSLKMSITTNMNSIGAALQTLYADLIRRVLSRPVRPGVVYVNVIRGRKYYYAKHMIGRTRVSRALGPKDDPAARRLAERLLAGQELARQDRTTISVLKRAGVPAPAVHLGRILDALSAAGMFDDAVLVGAAAYQCYPPIVGYVLPSVALMAQDGAPATVRLVCGARPDDETVLEALRRAEPDFEAVQPQLPGAPGSRFRSTSTGFDVELLSVRHDGGGESPAPAGKEDAAGTAPYQLLCWLAERPVRAVVLFGNGVTVRLPQPARHAVYRLIVAQARGSDRGSREKDLLQAEALITALREGDPYALSEAFANACAHGGQAWQQAAEQSLAEIGLTIEMSVR